MEKISFFLEKFKSLGVPSSVAKNFFLETVRKILSIELPPENLTFRNGTMYVRAEPTVKSELYLKRRAILTELAKNLGPVRVGDIR